MATTILAAETAITLPEPQMLTRVASLATVPATLRVLIVVTAAAAAVFSTETAATSKQGTGART